MLPVILVVASFTYPMVEDKATGFTENGLKVMLTSFVKEIISEDFLIRDTATPYTAVGRIDSAYFGNYSITEQHQIGTFSFL